MQKLYKIVGGDGGKCECGHQQRVGKCYFLVDVGSRQYTLCQQCGIERGLDNWWGARKVLTVEEMKEMWFGAEPIKEVVCRQLPRYTRELRSSTKKKREEKLRVAVEV